MAFLFDVYNNIEWLILLSRKMDLFTKLDVYLIYYLFIIFFIILH